MRTLSLSAFALLVLASSFGCRPPVKEPPPQPVADAGQKPWPHLHSHNDYEQPRPLFDALDAKMDSVEADLYFQNGDLAVSHDGVDVKGTLKALYLDPLKLRVQQNNGSVYGDGKPFFLWLDLKESSTDLQTTLLSQLSQYSLWSTFSDSGETEGPITIILTGNTTAKEALVDTPAPRPFVRDFEPYSDTDPPADWKWRYYAISYGLTIFWDGIGTMPPTQRRNMQQIIDGVHSKGRQIRFYASPDTEAYWQVARETGLDFISTDTLQALRGYVDQNP